ncbi:hypothetical protein [Singulisphaera sp. PoT]|uniref:hypothetical protein n=1 Tax=Singulisphaera sp. PoT TaxID=3411797 RepID=UPI003BF61911
MKRPRITIAHAILMVLIASICLAALRGASQAWAGLIESATFFLMIGSILGIAYRRGDRRVYWVGFAALGWGYLILYFIPLFYRTVGSHLLAPNLFAQLFELVHPEPTIPPTPAGGGFQSIPVAPIALAATAGGLGPGMGMPFRDSTGFIRVGVCMEALLWAYLGGWLARYFASRPDDETPAAQPSTQGAGASAS